MNARWDWAMVTSWFVLLALCVLAWAAFVMFVRADCPVHGGA